jgi:Na+-translocating ferredoxin:NAD+ oxidoreductase RNF subunit RnfB
MKVTKCQANKLSVPSKEKNFFHSVFNDLKTGSQDQIGFCRNTIKHFSQRTKDHDSKKDNVFGIKKLTLTKYCTLKCMPAGKLECGQFMCMHVHQFCWQVLSGLHKNTSSSIS